MVSHQYQKQNYDDQTLLMILKIKILLNFNNADHRGKWTQTFGVMACEQTSGLFENNFYPTTCPWQPH